MRFDDKLCAYLEDRCECLNQIALEIQHPLVLGRFCFYKQQNGSFVIFNLNHKIKIKAYKTVLNTWYLYKYSCAQVPRNVLCLSFVGPVSVVNFTFVHLNLTHVFESLTTKENAITCGLLHLSLAMLNLSKRFVELLHYKKKMDNTLDKNQTYVV